MLCILANTFFWIGATVFGIGAKYVTPVIYTTTVQNKVQIRCFSRKKLHLINCKVILRFLVFSSCYKCVFEPKKCLLPRIFGANLQRMWGVPFFSSSLYWHTSLMSNNNVSQFVLKIKKTHISVSCFLCLKGWVIISAISFIHTKNNIFFESQFRKFTTL